MLYVQVITALEAYLADTLISHVIYDKEHLFRLIQKDKGLCRERYSEAIAIRHDLVHRNGRKKGEEGYHFIRRPDVEYLADTVERLVHETQGQIDILLGIPF